MFTIILVIVLIAHALLGIFLLGFGCAKTLHLLRTKNVTRLSLTLIGLFMVIGGLWSVRQSIDPYFWNFVCAVLFTFSPPISLMLYFFSTRGKKRKSIVLISLGLLSIIPLCVLLFFGMSCLVLLVSGKL